MSLPSIPSVTVQGAADQLAAGIDPQPLLVDVRERHEFELLRVPGSVLLPLSTFGDSYRQLPTDRPLLLLCAVGGRSGRATEFLLANGYPDVTNVSGGLTAWNAAGLGVRTGTPEAGEGELPA